MLMDIPPNRYRSGKEMLIMGQSILESNQRLIANCNGIRTAPIKQSDILKQTIRRLEVFCIDCFVAKKETIRTTLTVIITGQ